MILRDGVFLALRAITAHRMRSGLTLLGIAVGIAAVILLTSIGEGIHRFVLAEFSQFGTNIIGVAPGRVKTGGAAPSACRPRCKLLTFDDARALRKLPNVTAIGPVVFGNAEIEGNGRTRRTTVYGVIEDALQVFNMKVAAGQFLPAGRVGKRARLRRARQHVEERTVRLRPTRSARGCAPAGCSSAWSACWHRRASSSASTSTTRRSSRPRGRWNSSTRTA